MHRCLSSICNAAAACEINFGVKKKGVYWRCVSILRWDSGCQSSHVKILANQSRACCIYNILYLKPASNSNKCGGNWTCKKNVLSHTSWDNIKFCIVLLSQWSLSFAEKRTRTYLTTAERTTLSILPRPSIQRKWISISQTKRWVHEKCWKQHYQWFIHRIRPWALHCSRDGS